MGSFTPEEKGMSPGRGCPAGLLRVGAGWGRQGGGGSFASFLAWPTACLHLTDLPFPPADLMSLKRMMEKLGVPKTHLEMKKMISEVTGGVSDTISYRDFVNMMLGKRSAVLKL